MKNLPSIFTLCLMVGLFIPGCKKSEEEKTLETGTAESVYGENEQDNTTAESVYRENEQNNAMLIKPGIGVGEVRFGMTVEEVKNTLGKPSIDVTGISFIYADLGIEVVAKDRETISAIVCVHHINNAPKVQACKYRTAEGIGIGSTESDIISAYGEPFKRSTDRLIYKDLAMSFRLADGQVNRIWVQKKR